MPWRTQGRPHPGDGAGTAGAQAGTTGTAAFALRQWQPQHRHPGTAGTQAGTTGTAAFALRQWHRQPHHRHPGTAGAQARTTGTAAFAIRQWHRQPRRRHPGTAGTQAGTTGAAALATQAGIPGSGTDAAVAAGAAGALSASCASLEFVPGRSGHRSDVDACVSTTPGTIGCLQRANPAAAAYPWIGSYRVCFNQQHPFSRVVVAHSGLELQETVHRGARHCVDAAAGQSDSGGEAVGNSGTG